MFALERLAKESGIFGIRINSGGGRKGTHLFYQAMGYNQVVDQKRFFKKLIDDECKKN